ncbi:spore germination protein [Terrihalobacillus insolitus]|uniref:spore germination protein n=1 Tax=Terrihalobacillus insolitus TaxID=2950438 RepID=UPI0023406B59|nr:spore germination protein [Terrihalobacillus insolitus]MDC3412928.1 spore germination protein [Terrihalobacillus insolitus]
MKPLKLLDILNKLSMKKGKESLLKELKMSFTDVADFNVNEIGETPDYGKVYICYLSTLVNAERVHFLMQNSNQGLLNSDFHSFSGIEFSVKSNPSESVQAILKGNAIICSTLSVDGIAFDIGESKNRSVDLPQSENVIRGPMNAFIEDYSTNLSLIRQRIHSQDLKVWEINIGKIANVKVGVLYLSTIANDNLIKKVKKELEKIDTDGLQDVGQIRELMTNKKGLNIFPMMFGTERPDRVAASLLDGRVIIMMNGTPFTLIAPTVFIDFWHSTEDYYLPPIIATFMRSLRFIALAISVFLPGIYVALASVNTESNRLEIALSIAGSREGVPYPVLIETIAMLLIMDLVVEAGVRLPKTIGPTATMVGGVVLGQAVVEANIVSNLVVIITATTAISNFIVVDYHMGLVHRMMKYMIVLFASVFGLLGLVISFTLMVTYLSQLESFGTPYLSPIGPYTKGDIINVIFRPPLKWVKKPGKILHSKNTRRSSNDK